MVTTPRRIKEFFLLSILVLLIATLGVVSLWIGQVYGAEAMGADGFGLNQEIATSTLTFTYTASPTVTLTPTISPTPTNTLVPSSLAEFDFEWKLVEDLDDNQRLSPGDTISVTITYHNQSDDRLTNVRLSTMSDGTWVAELHSIDPAPIESVDGTEQAQGADRASYQIEWSLGAIEARADATVTYQVRFNNQFPSDGSYHYLIDVSLTADQAEEKNEDFTVTMRLPNLAIEADASLVGSQETILSDREPNPGDTVDYEIRVSNMDAEVAAVNMVVEVTIDPILEDPTEISGDGSLDGQTLQWEFDVLAPGEEIVLTYRTRISSDASDGRTVSGDVTALCDGCNPKIEAFDWFTVVRGAEADTQGVITLEASDRITNLAIAFLICTLIYCAGLVYLVNESKGVITENKERASPLMTALRDGFLVFIVIGAILVLSLAGHVERTTIVGLIGTIAGYVLRGTLDK